MTEKEPNRFVITSMTGIRIINDPKPQPDTVIPVPKEK